MPLPRVLPAGHAGRLVRRVADQRPLAAHRGTLRDRYLCQRARPVTSAFKIGEDHRLLRAARQVRPAGAGRTVEAAALEGAEQDRPLRAGAALVLDRPGQGQQHRLGHDVGPQAGVTAAELGEDRRPGALVGAGDRVRHRRGQRQAARPACQDLGQQVAVGFAVPPLAAGRALRAGQAVALLPVPQPGDRDPGPPRDLADRQHGRVSDGVSAGGLRDA